MADYATEAAALMKKYGDCGEVEKALSVYRAYIAISARNRRSNMEADDFFAKGAIYHAGYIAGIRAERARRRRKPIKEGR